MPPCSPSRECPHLRAPLVSNPIPVFFSFFTLCARFLVSSLSALAFTEPLSETPLPSESHLRFRYRKVTQLVCKPQPRHIDDRCHAGARALVDFTSESSDVAHESPQVSNLAFKFSKTKPTDTPSTALAAGRDRVEVAIHMAVEQHPTGRTSDDDPSTIISKKSACPSPTVSQSTNIPQTLTRNI